jgi:hypothetical protein
VEAAELLPVRVEDERALAAPVAAPGPVGRMEIVLAAGERILVGALALIVQETFARWRICALGEGGARENHLWIKGAVFPSPSR